MDLRAVFRLCAVAATVLCVGAHTSTVPMLSITPLRATLDTPLRIRVVGVTPGTMVDLESVVNLEYKTIWRARARFRADADGTVDVDRQAPISGSYSGVRPMGLIWSMHQMTKTYPGLGSNAPNPITYTITARTTNGMQMSQAVQRLRIADGVRCRNVNTDSVLAYVCYPNDGRFHPGIVVLGGSEGGEQRGIASLLAAHGYAAMALAYFGVGRLPNLLREIPVETVGHGLQWFTQQPFVEANHIGLWGGSKGGELALLSATVYPQFRAVVSQYGSPMVWYGWRGYPPKAPTSSWSIKGRPLPFIPYTKDVSVLPSIDAPQFIPIEKINGPILFVAGTDDREWPSVRMARLGMQRLKVKHHPYRDRLLAYSHAGHGFAPPYYPVELNVPLGGTADGDAAASIKSWRAELQFFDRSLRDSRATAGRLEHRAQKGSGSTP